MSAARGCPTAHTPSLGAPVRRWGRLASRPALALASILALSPAPPAGAAPAPAAEVAPPRPLRVERAESDILLLALHLDRSILAESLTAYPDRGRILVPFGEICRLLDLGIAVDVGRGIASGFFLSEDRLFHLDAEARTVVVEGREKRFDPAGVELHADDLYVDAALFSAWLPIHLEVDLFSSRITVRPEEKLPLQLRLARASRLERSQASRPELTSLPRLEVPYRLWDGPFVDQTLRLSHRSSADGDAVDDLQTSTYLTADLFKMEMGAFLSGTDRGVGDSRFHLGRKDPEAGLLGGLHAREVTVGDVFHPGLDLIALPRSGPGLLISSFPLQVPTQFDRQSFRGDLPPGWEAELYRGEELLAYAQSRPDGRYEFLEVPLLFGLNLFRIELYGPQGQRKREIQRLNVGETLTPKGEVYYRLAGNDPSARLAGTGQLGIERRGSLEVSAGLSRHLSASAGVAAVDLEDGRHTYGTGSLRGYWGWIFANAGIATDRYGGSAWQGTVQSRLGAFGLLAQHARLRKFESEALVSGLGGLSGPSALASRTTLRLDTALPESFLPRIPLLFEAQRDELVDGRQLSRIRGRFSVFRRGFFLANQATWSSLSPGDPAGASLSPTPARAFGHLLASRYLQSGSVRGELDYNLHPEWEVTSALLTAERRFGRGFVLSAGLNRAFRGERTRYLLGLSRLEGIFGFGVTADYSRGQGFGLSLLLSASAGRDPRTGDWHPQARALAGSGGLSARAFLDLNGNGRRDPEEQPIAGAGFLLNGGGSLGRTDAAGVAFLANLQPYQDLGVALSPTTLEDPYWKPAQEGVRILPRPGKVVQIDFPVQALGEILGTLFVRRDQVSRVAGNVELELVEMGGTVVRRTRSAYDGFYDIAEVEPGRYRLRVAAGEAARLRLTSVPSRAVEIAPSGTLVEGFNLYLTETFLTDLQPPPDRGAGLSSTTLQDPSWQPAREGGETLPRPGEVARNGLPVPAPGEIRGTLFVRRGQVSRVAGNVELELVDAGGKVVRRSRSADGGLYDIAEVEPGRYRLRVAAEEAARLRLTAAPSRAVELAPSGTIVEGFNLYLTERGEGEAPGAAPGSLALAPRTALSRRSAALPCHDVSSSCTNKN